MIDRRGREFLHYRPSKLLIDRHDGRRGFDISLQPVLVSPLQPPPKKLPRPTLALIFGQSGHDFQIYRASVPQPREHGILSYLTHSNVAGRP